jgi:hypothetical protein
MHAAPMLDPQRRQLLTLLATLPGVIAVARAEGAAADSAASDFDFLLGDWKVRHRRLAQRLVGSNEWEEYAGTTHCQAILGGIANFNDSIVHRSGATYRSLGLRAFDPNTKVWTDWSLDGRNPTRVTVDGVGQFANRIGTFFADDTYDGKPVRVRGTFRPLTDGSAQWQQAYSADGGRTWETNYVMHYTR